MARRSIHIRYRRPRKSECRAEDSLDSAHRDDVARCRFDLAQALMRLDDEASTEFCDRSYSSLCVFRILGSRSSSALRMPPEIKIEQRKNESGLHGLRLVALRSEKSVSAVVFVHSDERKIKLA